MKNRSLRLAFVLCAFARPALADEPAFEFTREIKTPPLKQEELLSIILDAHVFASTQGGLGDIRLFDEKGNTVPYLLRKLQTTRPRSVRNTWPAREPTVRPVGDGLEIIVQLNEKDPHPNGLSLITPLRNFEQRVRVYTSADGDWEPAGKEAVLFDYSRYMDARNDSVSFPETARRRFRIVVDDVTVEQQSELTALTRRLQGEEETERTEQAIVDRRPFRIDRIDFWREVVHDRATGDEKSDYAVMFHDVEQDKKKQQTIIPIDTERQPLTSLKLETPDRNFSRHATVEVERVQGVKRSWEQIGEGTISRIDFKNLKREELSISFPESRRLRCRMIIDNRDSPILNVTGIKAEGNVYELVFLAHPKSGYTLLYGSADAESADYDTAAIQQLLNERFEPARASLGEQTPRQRAGGPAAFKWSKILNSPLLLGGAITLLVIVLGWGLYRALKRVEKLPGE